MSSDLRKIELQVLDQPVRILTDDPSVTETLSACYSAFLQPLQDSSGSPIELKIHKRPAKFEWSVAHGDVTEACSELADLIYFVEKMMTIELQRRRPELFFLHAAALSANGKCIVIAGESGAGKSTLCWDLCHVGFKYMSDELAPVNLDTLQVEAYPHAICLKRIAEQMPPLPSETIRSESTMHVPVEAIPGGFNRGPAEIHSIIFLHNSDGDIPSRLVEMPRSQAAAYFYANGLNQLAHERDGLRAAADFAGARPCFKLARGNLRDMRDKLVRHLQI